MAPLLLSFLVVSFILHQAESIRNPILNRPGEIMLGLSLTKEGDTFHMLTSEEYGVRIWSSQDLQTWTKLKNFRIKGIRPTNWRPNNKPPAIVYPSLYIHNGTFLLYFMSPVSNRGNGIESFCLEVASSGKLRGPFDLAKDYFYCTKSEIAYFDVLVTGGQITLFSLNAFEDEDKVEGMKAMNMSSDGLSIDSTQPSLSVSAGDLQEVNSRMYPRLIQIKNFFYLFYSVQNEGIYVLRSITALGPYEKQGEKPFLAQPVGTELNSELGISQIVQGSNDTYVFLFGKQRGGAHNYNIDARKFRIESGWPILVD